MGRLLEAADKWVQMTKLRYQLVIGHRHETRTIDLSFRKVDFDHLSGIHYASDIDFHLHRNQYRGEKLIPMLQTKTLDDELIEKSEQWPKIQKRLLGILELENLLDDDFMIYEFSPNKLPFHSKIHAVYLIYSELYRSGMFLFLDSDGSVFYCKSIFNLEDSDYRTNQTKWTVLKKDKICGDKIHTLYTHPNYKAE